MNSPCHSRPIGITLLTALLCLGGAPDGHAQYQWRDENGRMVISDQPPPPNIKPSQVLRAEPMPSIPRPSGNVSFSGNRVPGESQSGTSARRAETALDKAADRDLDARRKAGDRQEIERKQKEDADKSARLAKACDEAKSEIRSLESGIRIARINQQGEREYLGDDQRAARLDSVRREIKDLCPAG